jgi:hypothetical protein
VLATSECDASAQACCARPGCSAVLATAGRRRAQRSYCSATHRRQHRNVIRSARADSQPGPRTTATGDVLVGMAEDPAGSDVAGVEVGLQAPPRTRRWFRVVSAAILSVLTLVVAGLLERPPPVVTLQAPAIPVVDAGSDWATRANATVISLSRQLEVIAQAEQAWAEHEAAYGETQPPAELETLTERKAMLVQQCAVLESQLATRAAITPTAADLADYNQQIAQLDRQLAALTPEPSSSEDDASIRSLRQQRDAVAGGRDAKRDELELLRQGFEEARRWRLPDARDHTMQLAAAVVDVINAATQRHRTWSLPLWARISPAGQG